ncbi:hypothetical protein SSX86_012428 [Deinandra increscens subsp. villosa]|uniref:RING-type E3 ubiquitin transferase n=1 Tax=Deinandra increscens subsp. villosa TaxID=3103831 RepID=A0AAP0D8Q2_9ASTR
MGGCCSSSQKFQLHGTPIYNYCPPALEEHESTTTPLETSPFSTRLLIDVNLDTSTPDTYRSPPTPIPFDVVLGIPQSTNMRSNDQAFDDLLNQKPTPPVKVKIFDHVAAEEGNTAPILESPNKAEVGFQTSKCLDCSTTDEEDVCPTCFEEYDAENPRIVTKCEHQFHLSCILEWMERSNTCPICSQVFFFCRFLIVCSILDRCATQSSTLSALVFLGLALPTNMNPSWLCFIVRNGAL